MKRTSHKKSAFRHKSQSRRAKKGSDHPLEFDRGWQELEAQHDRIKCDWMSLAAQMGIGSKNRTGYAS
jgi:hypothetical protein